MSYKVIFSRYAIKDAAKIKKSNLQKNCQGLIEILAKNPFAEVPPYKKLVGDLQGFYSRRINIQHRLVYEVDQANKVVKVLRMWSHY